MLKPPVTLPDLMSEWSKDTQIDDTELGKELNRIPGLTSKYMNISIFHNLKAQEYAIEYAKKRKIKVDWLTGDLNNPEDLKKHGLEPNQKKVYRQDLPLYLESDDELNQVLLRKIAHEAIVDYCKSVIKELNTRTWTLKASVEWARFTQGEL